MELYYKQRQEYDKELETVNGIISGGTSLEPLVINISSRSLEEILEEITQGIESGFHSFNLPSIFNCIVFVHDTFFC